MRETQAEKYAIRDFPTVLLLDAEGNVLERTGYQPGGAEAYIEHIKSLLKKFDSAVKFVNLTGWCCGVRFALEEGK